MSDEYIDPINPYTGQVSVIQIMKNQKHGQATYPKLADQPPRRPWSEFEDVPTEIIGASRMLGILTEMRGYEYWEIGPCADRRLVALLQSQLEKAHQEITTLKTQLGI
jgi:hypothetical protein